MKRNHSHYGNSEGLVKEKGTESVIKAMMSKNFPNLGGEKDIQIHKAQRIPSRLNQNRATPKYIIVKSSKIKTEEASEQQEKRQKLQ